MVKGEEKKDTRIEAYGVKGLKSIQWRRIFKSEEALDKWMKEHDAELTAVSKLDRGT